MAICFADSIFLYNFAPNKEQNPAKRAGRGAWTGVQAEITPVEPDADNAAVGKDRRKPYDFNLSASPYLIILYLKPLLQQWRN